MQTLESLQSIFKDRIFKIPDYQRGYAWQKNQLIDFWEDIVNLPDDHQHYTGMLTLNSADGQTNQWILERWLINDRNTRPYYVVDGQQRLTTFIIFISEFTKLVRNLDENVGKKDSEIFLGTFSLADISNDYLAVTNPRDISQRSYKFSYEVDDPSFKYMRHKILGEPDGGDVTETFYTLNLEYAMKFFADNLKHYYDGHGLEGVELLFKKLTQNLRFNLHEIGDDFDVFVAFETMNNRGKKLSNLELLKNRLIYLTTLFKDEEYVDSGRRQSLRDEINESWKEVYFHLGRNKTRPLSDDDFLRAHWIIQFAFSRKRGSDYVDFLLDQHFTPRSVYGGADYVSSIPDIHEVNDSDTEDEDELIPVIKQKTKILPSDISKYVKSLRHSAAIWYYSYNPYQNQNISFLEQKLIDRLNRVGIAYFRPLVVSMYLSDRITTDERIRLLKEIERFIFIAFRVTRYLSNYKSSEYSRFAKDLNDGKITPDEIIKSLRDNLDVVGENKVFNHRPFLEFMGRKFRDGNGYYAWNGLHYFLYEYEKQLAEVSGNDEKVHWESFTKSVKNKVSIEHVYPQTPTAEYWNVQFIGYNDEQKKVLTGSIGNLVALSQQKNSSLQNDEFPLKKVSQKDHKGYKDGSHSEIEIADNTDWNPDVIRKRGLDLLAFMEKRWDIQFENSRAKEDLLFLNFMNSEDDSL